MRAGLLLALPALLLAVAACSSGLTLMSYNVENLFDDVDNGSEFPEFDPGRGKWNAESFALRLEMISEAVRRSVPGGPDIMVLQEVENERALRALTEGKLADLGYRWLAIVAKKGLAANVAIASRLPLSRVHAWQVADYRDNKVRDVLEAEVAVGSRVLHLFANHWKSKEGGVEKTEPSRREAASRLVARIGELLAADPGAEVVVAGDLNENLDEWDRVDRAWQTALVEARAAPPQPFLGSSILLAATAGEAGPRGAGLALYEPWFEVPVALRGSYVYGKQWETVDHILLSPGLLDGEGLRYRAGTFHAVRLGFLLSANGTPKRWTGLKDGRGYSDHLPIVLAIDNLD